MRIRLVLPALALALLALGAGIEGDGQRPFARLRGPYLGQTPPGLSPELFAPGLIAAGGDEGSSGFAWGGTVFLFQRLREGRTQTYITRLENGAWAPPRLIPFWETMAENGDFAISSDDRTMLYQVRTMTEAGPLSHVWHVEITPSGWGEAAAFPPPVNTRFFESFASDTADGTLYFFSGRPGGKGGFDLYKSARGAVGYGDPVNLAALNTEYNEWDPFVAPDGSRLIFCSTKPGGSGRDDLYVSFRQSGGEWGPAVNMGPDINSAGSENRPWVSRDGKYFFYTSTRNGRRETFWVRAGYLDRFRKPSGRPD